MVSSSVIVRALLIIILLGIFLRVYNLDAESLWTDEAFSLQIARQPSLAGVVQGVAATEAAPPGYYLLLHHWIKITGDSVFNIRLLSVIFSVLALVILFLAVRLVLNYKIALLSALFMATSMLQIEYAQEARIYGWFTFLSLCSVYFFVRWYKGQTNKWLGWYALTTLLALYVNYMALFLVLGYSLFLFLPKENINQYRKKWLLTHGLIFLFCLPLIPLILAQFQTLNTGLAETLVRRGMPSFLAQGGLFLFALPAFFFMAISAILISRPKIKNLLLKVDTYFFPLMLLAGFAYLYVSIKPFILAGIPFIRVPITNSYFLIRHSFFLVPLWYVYLGYKVDRYFRSGKKYLAAAIIIMVLFFSFFSLHQYYVQPTKPQWPEAVQFIKDNENSVSAKVLVLLDKGGASNTFLFRYYAPADWLLLRLTWAGHWRDFQRVDEEKMFALLDKTDEFWLLLSRNEKTGNYYSNLLDLRYERKEGKELYGVKVYRYAGKKAPERK